MATLTVFRFEAQDAADRAIEMISKLTAQQLIQVHDAATVTWPAGSRRPRTKHLGQMAGRGALDGAFWGTLFGMVFFVPFFGMAIGEAIGLGAKFRDCGISENFIKSVRDRVTEGTSAVFLLTRAGVLEKIADAIKSLPKFELITSNLSKQEEATLRAAFASEPTAAAPGMGA